MSYAQYPGATFFGVRKNGIFDTVVASNLITSNLEQAPAPPLSITCYTVAGALNTALTYPASAPLYYDTLCTKPVSVPGNLIIRSTNINSGSGTSVSDNLYFTSSIVYNTPVMIGDTELTDNGTGAGAGANNTFVFTDPNTLGASSPTISNQYLGISNYGVGYGPGQFTVIATFY